MKRLRPWRHWTVRTRIVVSVVSISAVALIAANFIAVLFLNWYLIQRVDQQLAPRGRTPSEAPSGRRPNSGFSPGPDFQVFHFNADGRLDASTETPLVDPKLFGDIKRRAAAEEFFTVDGPTAQWRVRVQQFNNGDYAAFAISLKDVAATRDQMVQYTSGVSLLLLILVGVATWALVRVGLAPLTRMEEAAAEIAAGNLSRRIDDADPHTESGRLGGVLNTMMTRIEAAVDESAASERRLRQFLADAAHELRTPLTSVQGFAELYRRGGAPPGPALDEAMECIELEVGRMRLLVNDLLTLARLDEERPLQQHPVDLLAVAADTVRDAHVRVPTRFVQLAALDERSATFEPVTVEGDETRLRQVVANLVSNALQHTPEDTRIVVKVGRAGPPTMLPIATIGGALPEGVPLGCIEVSDTGPGMKPEDATRVFERLYRAEGSRSRRYGGAGLGLSIVASIVQAHGGRVELWTAPGQGATFRVLLPALDLDFLEDLDPDEPEEMRATGFRGNSEVR
ncbi:sensor histidine kinase [Dactylosporangium matsuzakiense]|uniref:histidine kinase n=1 Tax=Dactylosporangium matsuzakiense TaxID=53360 RepID=A0A9W6KG99_9ACTN|nr:HAMP domain-containing sensor histidine kinase [Dactylosporangium matsuzakiense]UWZ45111.1 HAMP domain-containing histidine kinase [Dactylosporangium matsuzakiense]GLK98943.1 two-component sensor histidine kinase [Dactylosporangium matsuzakiense]